MPRGIRAAEFLVQQEGEDEAGDLFAVFITTLSSTAAGAGDPAALRLHRGVAELEGT